MPWPSDAPFYNFNEFSILLNAKPRYGVYAVFNTQRQPILIDAGHIMVDLIRLAEGGNHQFQAAGPALFSYVLVPWEMAEVRKRELIAELMPQLSRARSWAAAG